MGGAIFVMITVDAYAYCKFNTASGPRPSAEFYATKSTLKSIVYYTCV